MHVLARDAYRARGALLCVLKRQQSELKNAEAMLVPSNFGPSLAALGNAEKLNKRFKTR